MRSWTENRILMSVCFASMAALGLLILLTDGSGRLALGIAFLVMFGGGGFAWWFGEFRSTSASPPHLGRVSIPVGILEPAIVLPMSAGRERAKVLAMAAFGLGFLVVAVFPEALGNRGGPLMRLLMFGLAALIGWTVWRGIRGWNNGELLFAVTPSGLLVQALHGVMYVPWNAITHVSAYRMRGQPQLGIGVTTPRAFEGTAPMAPFDRFERPLTGHDRSLWLGGFALAPEVVEALVSDYLDHPEKRRQLGHDQSAVDALLKDVRMEHGLTDVEKRHARSLGRWLGVGVLLLYGAAVTLFAGGVGVRVMSRVVDGADRVAVGGLIVAAVVVFGVVGVVAICGLLQLIAGVGIAMRRERARNVGLALSAIGAVLGVVSLGAVVVLGEGGNARVWALPVVATVGYAACLLTLHAVGDLRRLAVDAQSVSTS